MNRAHQEYICLASLNKDGTVILYWWLGINIDKTWKIPPIARIGHSDYRNEQVLSKFSFGV